MTQEQADEALARELRLRARLEHQRRFTIETCALVVERLADELGEKTVMRAANAIRATLTKRLDPKETR